METFKILARNELGALASPLRQELLDALSEPDSAVNLARRFDMSRQRVGYHMRELEKAGCIELAGERPKRGLTERLYRVRPLAYVRGPEERTNTASQQDRFSWATLLNLVATALGDLVNLRERAERQGKRLSTLAIEADISFANPKSRREFTEELMDAVEILVRKHHRPEAKGARRFCLFLGAYPSPIPSERDTRHE